MTTVAIPFAPMPREQNPNVSASAGTDIYLKGAYVTFASIMRWNPSYDLIFATNISPSEEWVKTFESIGVEIQLIPFQHMPPAGFAEKFLGALYLLDVIQVIDDEYLILLDPDMVCVGSLEALTERRDSVSAIEIPSHPDVRINGLSPSEARIIHHALGGKDQIPVHYGGEMYGIPKETMPILRERLESAWESSIENWGLGIPYFTTEEHMMSFALAGMKVYEASSVVKRIWTAHSYRTVDGTENLLSLWHLPAEKERALVELYSLAVDPHSWFATASREKFIHQVGVTCGLHNRKAGRLALDMAGKLKRFYTRRILRNQ